MVHAGCEFGIYEVRRDHITGGLLKNNVISFCPHETQTILPVDQIRTQFGKPYSAFTPFRRHREAIFKEQTFPTYAIRCVSSNTTVESSPVPEQIDGFELWPGVSHWLPRSQYAEQRLDQFLAGPIGRYHEDRDRPDLDGFSSLYPWLSVGAL